MDAPTGIPVPLISNISQLEENCIFRTEIGEVSYLFVPGNLMPQNTYPEYYEARAATYKQLSDDMPDSDYSIFDSHQNTLQIVAINKDGELRGGARWQRDILWKESYLGTPQKSGGLAFPEPKDYLASDYIHTGRLWSSGLGTQGSAGDTFIAQAKAIKALYRDNLSKKFIGSLSFTGKLSNMQMQELHSLLLELQKNRNNIKNFIQGLDKSIQKDVEAEIKLLRIYSAFFERGGMSLGNFVQDTTGLKTWNVLLTMDIAQASERGLKMAGIVQTKETVKERVHGAVIN